MLYLTTPMTMLLTPFFTHLPNAPPIWQPSKRSLHLGICFFSACSLIFKDSAGHTLDKDPDHLPQWRFLCVRSSLSLITDHLGLLAFFSSHALNSRSDLVDTPRKSEWACKTLRLQEKRKPRLMLLSRYPRTYCGPSHGTSLLWGLLSNKLLFPSRVLTRYRSKASCTRTTRIRPLVYKGKIAVGSSTGPRWSTLKAFLAESTTLCRLRLPENINVLCYNFRKATRSQGNRNFQLSYILRGPPCTGGPLLTERSLRGTWLHYEQL